MNKVKVGEPWRLVSIESNWLTFNMDWNPCAYKIRIWIWNYLTYKLVKRGFVCLMLMFETKFLVVDCFCVRKMCNFPSRVFFYVSLVVTISFIQSVKKIMHCTYYSAVWNRCFCCLQELPLCYKHPLHTFHQLSHGKIMVWYMYLCSLICPVWFLLPWNNQHSIKC